MLYLSRIYNPESFNFIYMDLNSYSFILQLNSYQIILISL
jgi:hypothetical protein